MGLFLSYDGRPQKAGALLAKSDVSDNFPLPAQSHSYINAVFLTFLRNKTALEKILEKLSLKPPKKKLKCAILCAFADMLSDPDNGPRIADNWVGYVKSSFSEGEAKFLNALLRKFPATYAGLKADTDDIQSLSTVYSFPEWLISRYLRCFGKKQCTDLLKIENTPSKVFFRKSPAPEADSLYLKYSEFFEATEFQNFYKLKSGNWKKLRPLLDTPYFYAQDPSTSYAPEALAPVPGAAYLDLCASPGGKSRYTADLLLGRTLGEGSRYTSEDLKRTVLVSVDKGNRIKILRENMLKVGFLNGVVIDCDVIGGELESKLAGRKLPVLFDGVLLDAPCSNTGVLRRRPDIRWRLSESDIDRCAELQLKLLNSAAKFVRPGGKLVYSTCSIDPKENKENALRFIELNPGFKLIEGQTHIPTEDNDGAGVFIFLKDLRP